MKNTVIGIVISLLISGCGGGGSSSGGGGGNPVAGRFDAFHLEAESHDLQVNVYERRTGCQQYQASQLSSFSLKKGNGRTVRLPKPKRDFWGGAGPDGGCFEVYVRANGASHNDLISARLCTGRNVGTRRESCQKETTRAFQTRASLLTVVNQYQH